MCVWCGIQKQRGKSCFFLIDSMSLQRESSCSSNGSGCKSHKLQGKIQMYKNYCIVKISNVGVWELYLSSMNKSNIVQKLICHYVEKSRFFFENQLDVFAGKNLHHHFNCATNNTTHFFHCFWALTGRVYSITRFSLYNTKKELNFSLICEKNSASFVPSLIF